jgi:alkyldihydroxyacetonephosphate synthase
MHWSRWGDPAAATPLSAAARSLVTQALDLDGGEDRPGVDLADVRVPEPQVAPAFLGAVAALIGAEHVRRDRETRVRHTRGRSTPDLLRMRAGDAADAPDAVLLPGDAAQVQRVLEECSRARVAVVPYGGGTSVVGGLVAQRGDLAGVVALDLARLDRLLSVDPVSQTAELEAGLTGPAADALLAEHGLTLGHLPQSYEHATIGGFAATRSSGQASAGYGRFSDLVVGVRVATPVGPLELGSAPASAAGPDLRHLVLGSEGAFGVITSVTARVRPLPEVRVHEGWRFGSFAEGVEAVRTLAQSGRTPTVLRLSDELETAVGLARPAAVGAAGDAGCLLIAGYDGAVDEVASRRSDASAVLARLGGTPLGEEPGRDWEQGRFQGPYLRDALLDAGALVETLETATYWSGLLDLHAAVRDAVVGVLGRAVVLCHVSHVYPTGASLYFTVAAKQSPDPVAQWAHAKQAASEAIVSRGATITHHHAVGSDHRPWLEAEIGPVGVEVLRAVKDRLDPAGVLNPGVLVP